MEDTRTEATSRALEIIPRAEIDRVLNQQHCDIDMEFLGFLDEYYALSKVIPKHFTVLDLGCAYNPQSYFFTEHKEYIAVDLPRPLSYGPPMARFKPENCMIFEMDIAEYITKCAVILKKKETFAIMNYVPAKKEVYQLVNETFPNKFVFYPSNDSLQTELARKMGSGFQASTKES